MKTSEVIKIIDNLVLTNAEENFNEIEYIWELTSHIRENKDGYLACESLLRLFERYPEYEFGHPGEPVQTIEKHGGYYEDILYASIKKKPQYYTVWMLNRIINSIENQTERIPLIKLMENSLFFKDITRETKRSIFDFYTHQFKKLDVAHRITLSGKKELSSSLKLRELLYAIKDRVYVNSFNQKKLQDFLHIFDETTELADYGEWFVAFENMLVNLDEINFKLTDEELNLIKDIFIKANVNWKEKWNWIDGLKG